MRTAISAWAIAVEERAAAVVRLIFTHRAAEARLREIATTLPVNPPGACLHASTVQ
jgi:hypothetical protein